MPCLLDAYGIPYKFSDPLVLSMTLHKGMAKRFIYNMGIPKPAFFVIECVGVLEIFLKKNAEKEAYTLHNKENYRRMVKYRLAKDSTAERAEQMALTVWRGLGCKDAGSVNFRTDDQGLPLE